MTENKIYLATIPPNKLAWELKGYPKLSDVVTAVANNPDYPPKPFKVLKELDITTDLEIAKRVRDAKPDPLHDL